MKKQLLTICLSIVALLGVGCSTKSQETTSNIEPNKTSSINLGVPKSPPTIPILHMIENNSMGDNIKLNLDYWNSPEQLIAMTQDNKHDVFALPLTVGAKLHNKGVGIKLTNVNTWGVTYFVTADESIKKWSDLKGETIYVPQKSSPPDIMTRYFLESSGLKIGEDVELKYSNSTEITQLLKAGQIKHAVNLEPQVTNSLSGNENLKIVFSYDQEWKKLMGNEKDIPNAGIGATVEFIENNEDVMKKFEEEYEKSLNYLVENPEVAGQLGKKYFDLNEKVVTKAMPRLGLMYKDAKSAANDLQGLYQLLYDFNPDTIGGKIPSEEFYYSTK